MKHDFRLHDAIYAALESTLKQVNEEDLWKAVDTVLGKIQDVEHNGYDFIYETRIFFLKQIIDQRGDSTQKLHEGWNKLNEGRIKLDRAKENMKKDVEESTRTEIRTEYEDRLKRWKERLDQMNATVCSQQSRIGYLEMLLNKNGITYNRKVSLETVEVET